MSQTRANTDAIASLTQTSIGPSSASACSAAASTCVASATSVGMTSAVPPSRRTSSAAACSASSLRATSAMRAPRLANSRAVARPTPAEAPVRTMVWVEGLTAWVLPADRPPRLGGMARHHRIILAIGLVTLIAGGVMTAQDNGVVVVTIGLLLLGIGGVLLVSLAFLMIGESEDRHRERHPNG